MKTFKRMMWVLGPVLIGLAGCDNTTQVGTGLPGSEITLLGKSHLSDAEKQQVVQATLLNLQRLLISSNEALCLSTGVQATMAGRDELQGKLQELTFMVVESPAKLNYSPTDCFETFSFPGTHALSLGTLGETYHEHRRQVMLDRWEGLTKTYNRFHNRQEAAEDIGRLRELHVEMDHAVAAAYGWADLQLGHGFHETKQGVRYTISDPARREVLSRLLQLNHDRYAEEVAQGLHAKKKGKGKKATADGGLFGGEETAP